MVWLACIIHELLTDYNVTPRVIKWWYDPDLVRVLFVNLVQ